MTGLEKKKEKKEQGQTTQGYTAGNSAQGAVVYITNIFRDVVSVEKKLDLMMDMLHLMTSKIGDIDKRLDGIDNRLDGIDNRLDGMDKRFDGIDQRLDRMDKRFDGIDQRLDGMDKRFDKLEKKMDDGFADVDRRFDILANHLAEVSEKKKEEGRLWATPTPIS